MKTAPTESGWRYDPRKLVPQWDHFHRRMGYVHPKRPSAQALGYHDVFMGWTLAAAQDMCHQENSRLMQGGDRS